MAVLTEEMKQMIKSKRYAMVATATKDGIPNVVAMGSPRVLDDQTLGFGCGTKGKTYKNVHDNPFVAITVVDDKMREFQFKGKATVETSGPFFESLKAEWTKMKLVPQCVVKVAVSEIYAFPSKA
ncbi:MAG: pyridoxamine 5'-phosphate oxidase family protein [Dehalococcoidia bacterium]|nr:pyridoxamine 5'-phosphate oxidase family protein [Dehalococcoidia bacterium]